VPVERLTSKAYARDLAQRIRSGEKADVKRLAQPDPVAAESRNTTHVVVVDEDGNAVTMTHTLGAPSGVITEGLGFMYNGCMNVFDPRPAIPARWRRARAASARWRRASSSRATSRIS